jgi:outer membrane protein TolC
MRPALACLFLSAASLLEAADSVRVDQLLRDPIRLVSWLRENNEDVRATVARVGQAEADLAQSRLPPPPSLSTNLSDLTLGATNPAGLRFAETAIYSVGLSQTVELGKRGPRIAAARLRLSAGEEDYLDALSDAIGRARLALGRVAYLRTRTEALEESLSSMKEMIVSRTCTRTASLPGIQDAPDEEKGGGRDVADHEEERAVHLQRHLHQGR